MPAQRGHPRELHEETIRVAMALLKEQAYHVIPLEGKSPDCIATKDGRLIAVEILGTDYSGKSKRRVTDGGRNVRTKKMEYSMFDEVIVYTFYRNADHVDIRRF